LTGPVRNLGSAEARWSAVNQKYTDRSADRQHVALMGLEYTGYTPRNIETLWIDPYDYQDELECSVAYLSRRGIEVSLYNHQLCVLKPALWQFAKKWISDWKNLYLPECEACTALADCGGLFKWAVSKHSEYTRCGFEGSYGLALLNLKDMSIGRSIRIFLVDGTPTGLRTAEIPNWTGQLLVAP
jgi:hypothetical protein